MRGLDVSGRISVEAEGKGLGYEDAPAIRPIFTNRLPADRHRHDEVDLAENAGRRKPRKGRAVLG